MPGNMSQRDEDAEVEKGREVGEEKYFFGRMNPPDLDFGRAEARQLDSS